MAMTSSTDSRRSPRPRIRGRTRIGGPARANGTNKASACAAIIATTSTLSNPPPRSCASFTPLPDAETARNVHLSIPMTLLHMKPQEGSTDTRADSKEAKDLELVPKPTAKTDWRTGDIVLKPTTTDLGTGCLEGTELGGCSPVRVRTVFSLTMVGMGCLRVEMGCMGSMGTLISHPVKKRWSSRTIRMMMSFLSRCARRGVWRLGVLVG
ncbi:hypothetical protein B0J17DRAFT_294111 [Rhizoctonia solani]|nr:hypothetical protein B0J17DRAFT_294111 [Rhizoctonia solani]